MKKVLIFGGSGQIGRHLIRRLTKKNHLVTVVTRNLHKKGVILKTQGNPGYIEVIEANVIDEHIIARGSTDNKGNIVSRLAAFEAFLAIRGELPCNIKYLIEGEEEIGSPSLENYVSKNKDVLGADGCVWDDNTKRVDIPVLSLGN